MQRSAPVGLTRSASIGMGPTGGYDLYPDILFPFLLFLPHVLLCVTSCCSPPALFGEPVSFSLSVPSGPGVWGNEVTSNPLPRALSVIAVRPELDTLYKQMNEQNRGEGQGRACVLCVNILYKVCNFDGISCLKPPDFSFLCVCLRLQVIPRTSLCLLSHLVPTTSTTSPATASYPIMPFNSISWVASPRATR